MKDCMGRDLNIGDKVICSEARYADLLLGEVIGFTDKKIRISYVRSSLQQMTPEESLKYFWQVFKYE